MPTRRHFLLNCTALAFTAAAAPTLALGAPRDISLDQISMARFKDCRGETFKVSIESKGSFKLILVKVEELVSKNAQRSKGDAANEKFRLLFQGDLSATFTQDSYSFENAKLGRFTMFVTPVKCKDQGHCYYEAIFNRLAR